MSTETHSVRSTDLNSQDRSVKGESVSIREQQLVRNTFFNFVGQAVPLVIAIISLPFIVGGLGTERFGLLALVWVILGYFSFFDLGLGKATTKFVAEALAKRQIEMIRQYVWVTILTQGALGFLGLLILVFSTPFLVERVFRMAPELVAEAKTSFYVLAGSVPVVLVSSSLRGVLEGGQRFDLVNAVKVPSSAANFLVPLVGVIIGLNLPAIILFILVARVITLFAFGVLCLETFPVLKRTSGLQIDTLRLLLRFGGWVTVSNVVVPILFHLDRFLIGSLLSMTSVAYYTASYELVSRLSIFSASIVMTLFPAMSYMGANCCRANLQRVYAGSVKYLLLLMGPVALVLVLFAEEILAMWLGNDFAENGTAVVRIISLGMLVNLLAWIPYTVLQSLGRPDVGVKFLLFQVPAYSGLAWLLTKHLGITGTAVAWSLILGIANCLFAFFATWKLFSLSPRIFVRQGVARSALAIAILGTACTACLDRSLLTRVIMGGLSSSFFLVLVS